jgi:hypothetical protein
VIRHTKAALLWAREGETAGGAVELQVIFTSCLSVILRVRHQAIKITIFFPTYVGLKTLFKGFK